jgi:hypothetical protein
MCANLPNVTSLEAEEGTAAHYVAQMMLETFKLGGDGFPIGQSMIGRTSPNGVIITEEMFDGALTYYNVITAVVGANYSELMIEVRVSAHHTLDPQAFGTADAIYFERATNTLYIWDFKFGHYSVKAYGNLQLVAYAVAAGETFNFVKIHPRLSLHIVQPRCYDGQGPVRTWTCTYDDLRADINFMEMAIVDHRMNKGLVKSGEWCRECPAAHKCPAIRQAVAVAIDYSTTPIPLNMSNEALAYEMDLIDIAEARIKQRKAAISTEAEARVRAGQLVPGRRMTETTGNRKWSIPDSQVFELGLIHGLNFRTDPKPVTVAAAEALLKRKRIDGSVINQYYHKPKTGMKLIADDGSRAKQIFSQEKI